MSDEGQSELLRRIDIRAKKPSLGLWVFDYTSDTTALVNDGDDWIEVELTAGTRACDTVMPRAMAQCIPIQPSLQSLSSMVYEVANGNEIQNCLQTPLRHVDGGRERWLNDQPPSGRRAQSSLELEQVRRHGVRESVREASRRADG